MPCLAFSLHKGRWDEHVMGMEELLMFASDERVMATVMPVVVYWAYSGMYELLGSFPSMGSYRLHSRGEEETKNLASKKDVLKGVLLQQAIQATITLLVSKMIANSEEAKRMIDEAASTANIFSEARRFLIAMVVFDTWQYMMHRYMHHNKFLYRRFHSWHHRIAAPYAFAAQYNHPVDGILTEVASGGVAYFVSGMSPSTAVVFYCFATVKGIDDHCGLVLPWNPFQLLFRNNTAYHDIHHQLAGSKSNFAQPFFVMWDRMLGTYTPYVVRRRKGGGFEAQLISKREENP